MSAKKTDPRVTSKYKSQRLRVLIRDNYTCYYCGTEDATQADHVVPISKGGDPISLDNMVAACARCNNAKGSRSQGLFFKAISTHHDSAKRISPRPITTSTTQPGPCLGQPAQGQTE